MKKTKISYNVIHRLPKYLRRLEELAAAGVNRISSADLGRQLGTTPSQVRQDLSTFGEFGLQGYGYGVDNLIDQIVQILGGHNGYRAILVGAGKLGNALISNFSFVGCGVTLLCAFDVRDDIIGTDICGVPVYDSATLPNYLEANSVDIAVLTVPKRHATESARLLQENGIEAIWNFTNVDIHEPGDGLLVENIHFSDSLYTLSYYLTDKRENNKR